MSCDYYKENNNVNMHWVCPKVLSKGMVHSPNDFKLNERTQKMLHYTLVFQCFVFLQVFNIINSRKIGENELNVFKDFFNNWLFMFIMALIFGIQMLLVEIGGKVVKTWPLNMEQNLTCMAVGSLSLFWALVIK